MGNDVIMAPDVIIWSTAHGFSRTDIPIRLQGATQKQPVIIDNDVWLGQRIILSPGVKIGNHAIVGAAAVVPKDVPPYAIVTDIPAKITRFREQT